MSQLERFVDESINSANRLESRLSEDVLSMEGMSSPKVRHLLNNLCRRAGTCYLEVGVFRGSTFVSALYANNDSVVSATAIDNFSQFGGAREAFEENCRTQLGDTGFNLHVGSFRNVNPSFPLPVNVYFYDGDHTALDQRDALLHFWPSLAGEFVFIVDDWNWPAVKFGTYEGITKSGGRVARFWELPAAFNGDKQQWWNGMFVAVIQK